MHGNWISSYVGLAFYLTGSFKLEELEEDRGPPEPTRVHHMLEDFLTRWTSKELHIEPLRKFLESCIGFDLESHVTTCSRGPLYPGDQTSTRNHCLQWTEKDIQFAHHVTSADLEVEAWRPHSVQIFGADIYCQFPASVLLSTLGQNLINIWSAPETISSHHYRFAFM